MKILAVCQYYYPEPFRINDICEELVKRGHSVTVLTGLPNYPMGEIYEEYKKNPKKKETINGVDVIRCFEIPRKTGAVYRFLNYFSYAFSSGAYVKKLAADFDVVFVNQLSPVMMAHAGLKYKKKYGKKLVLYSLDLWPESLVVGGVKKGSFVYRVFHSISEKLYKGADKLLITSKSFTQYMKEEFGIEKTDYLPQYAESLFDEESCRKNPDGKTNLMFAGNVGVAQSVDTIIEAANILKDEKDLFWHIVGDGSEIENIRKKAETYGLENVIFHGRQSLDKMPGYYSMADAMLITMQKDDFLSQTLPGKIQSYMAAGKAVIGAIDGEASAVINESGCGFCGRAEDGMELASNVKKFIGSENKKAFSENSIRYYNENFNRDIFVDKLEKHLEECVL